MALSKSKTLAFTF